MKIIRLDEVDSTNEYIKKIYQQLPACACVQAKRQTSGKGRRGHVWSSSNQNLAVTFLYKDITDIQEAWKYTMISAASVIDVLGKYGIEAKIKWPNDIYAGDQKICGMLVETILDPDLKGIISGIGINVNDARPYICMKDIIHQECDINEVLASLIVSMNHHMEMYYHGQFDVILDELNRRSYLKGKWLDYRDYGRISFLKINVQGMVEYIDENNQIHQMLVNEITLSQNNSHQKDKR